MSRICLTSVVLATAALVPARTDGFADEQVVHDGSVGVGLGCGTSTRPARLLLSCRVARAFVPGSGRSAQVAHASPVALDSDRRLSALLMHLVLHEDGLGLGIGMMLLQLADTSIATIVE